MTVSMHGLRTVIYPAPDLAAAKSWWSELLGFGPYFDEPFYVGYEVGGYELGLLPDADPAQGALTYWGVDDAAAAVEQALARGATVHAPATEVGDGIVTATVTTRPVQSSGSSTTRTSARRRALKARNERVTRRLEFDLRETHVCEFGNPRRRKSLHIPATDPEPDFEWGVGCRSSTPATRRG